MKTFREGFFGQEIEARRHPTLPVTCFADGSFIRYTARKDARLRSYGSPHPDGYRITKIQSKRYYVHRLIAETFLPNPTKLTTVDHIDRDKTNNSIGNLRWADSKLQADNRGFVLDRQQTTVRACEDLASYTRERRAYVKEHGHGYGYKQVIDDEPHRRQREINRRYRANNKERLKEIHRNYYLRRKARNESQQHA